MNGHDDSHRGHGGRAPALMRHFSQPEGAGALMAAAVMVLIGGRSNAQLVAAADLAGDERVLDAGCGPGVAVGLAARRLTTGTVVGVDPSPEMVAVATWRNRAQVRRGAVEIRPGSVGDLPAADGAFTVSWAHNSYHHWDASAAGFAELARVTASGGRLLIAERLSTPGQSRFGPPGLDDADVAALVEALQGAGFHDVASQPRSLAATERLVVVSGVR